MNMLYRTIRWIGRHVRGFHAAVGLFLLLGLALSVAALALFALVAELVGAGAVQSFDEGVLLWTRRYTSDWFDALALLGAVLGSGVVTWVVLVTGTVLFWRSRHHYSAILLWVSLLGGRLLNAELKALYDRPRPGLVQGDLYLLGITVPFPSSGSFPSGHALMSVVIFGTLAYLVVRLEPTVAMRRWTLGCAAALILLIGASRVYLAVHYPSDVLGGYLAGFIWATSCAFAIEAIRYFRSRKPNVMRDEKDLGRGIRPIQEAVHRESGS